MSEIDAPLSSGNQPATVKSLGDDLRMLGVLSGSVLLVHSSLSALGWVCGGEVAVISALLEAVGENGTLVMPTHSSDLSEPSLWQNPAVPKAWWPVIRNEMPPFDRARTPTRGMGRIPESFRSLPQVLRSDHPTSSFAAYGPHADKICGRHTLDDPFGDGTPLGVLYDLHAHVLLLGVGHASNTSIHLAERRAFGRDQVTEQTGSPIMVDDGKRAWVPYSAPLVDSDDFAELGNEFERESKQIHIGQVGQGQSRLMSQRALVDYAVQWLRRHRPGDGRPRRT